MFEKSHTASKEKHIQSELILSVKEGSQDLNMTNRNEFSDLIS